MSITTSILYKIKFFVESYFQYFPYQRRERLRGNYHQLSASQNTDNKYNYHYFEALNWALNNKDVSNIAITGIYGSGKSSILKSYISKYIKTSRNYINITLTNYTEKEHDVSYIEECIVKHMFFSKTKFNNNKHTSSIFITIWIVWFFICVLCVFKLNFNNAILKFIIASFSNLNANYFVISILINLVLIIYLAVLLILKLKFKNVSLDLKLAKLDIDSIPNNKINNSYIHDHTCEIVNFLIKQKISIVVFEDLERINKLEVLENLRELNIIANKCINNNKSRLRKKLEKYKIIKYHKVSFIFAISDNLLDSHLKGKFFDYILPVIPIVNFNTSKELLHQHLIEENAFSAGNYLHEGVIKLFSQYIYDSRLAFNIINDFKISDKLLNIKLSRDKIFVYVVLKNLCPKVYYDLYKNSGIIPYYLVQNEKLYTNTEDLENLSKKNGHKFIDSVLLEFILKAIRLKYIDENYIDYLSSFSIFNLDEIDRAYLINVNQKQSPSFSFKLYNRYEIIRKLDHSDFSTIFTLNNDLIDTLFNTIDKREINNNSLILDKSDFISKQLCFSLFLSDISNDTCKNFLYQYLISEYHYSQVNLLALMLPYLPSKIEILLLDNNFTPLRSVFITHILSACELGYGYDRFYSCITDNEKEFFNKHVIKNKNKKFIFQ